MMLDDNSIIVYLNNLYIKINDLTEKTGYTIQTVLNIHKNKHYNINTLNNYVPNIITDYSNNEILDITLTYKKELNDIELYIKYMEKIFNKKMQITIKSRYFYICLNSFKKRKNYQINIDKQYSEIKEHYKCYEGLKTKLECLQIKKAHSLKIYDDTIVWVCPYCEQWKNNKNVNIYTNRVCIYCNFDISTVYQNLHFNLISGEIFDIKNKVGEITFD